MRCKIGVLLAFRVHRGILLRWVCRLEFGDGGFHRPGHCQAVGAAYAGCGVGDDPFLAGGLRVLRDVAALDGDSVRRFGQHIRAWILLPQCEHVVESVRIPVVDELALRVLAGLVHVQSGEFRRGICFQVGRLEFHVNRVVGSVHVHLEHAGGSLSERERRLGCLGVDTVGETQRVAVADRIGR